MNDSSKRFHIRFTGIDRFRMTKASISTQSISANTASAVSALLADLRVSDAFHCRNTLHGRWGYAFGSVDHLTLHIVLAGECWLTVEGQADQRLCRGDVALLPSGIAHGFSDAAGRPKIVVTSPDANLESPDTGHGSDAPDNVVLVCGGARLSGAAVSVLLQALPEHVVTSPNEMSRATLRTLVDLLSAEFLNHGTAANPMADRLFEMILLETLRYWLTHGAPDQPWLQATRDPQIAAVLKAIHAAPTADWTLKRLAASADLSRSVLSTRFQALLGQSPMRYLAAHRMRLAADWLVCDRRSISDVAHTLGYESEPAFHRAFVRHIGRSPGAVRRAAA